VCLEMTTSYIFLRFVQIIHFLQQSMFFSCFSCSFFYWPSYATLFLQAALGESKKASDNAMTYVEVDNQKVAIGTLSADKYPQIQFDLVFEKEFELSHTSKAASVFFSGYKVLQPVEGDEYPLYF
jgi:hypothetical protein